MLWGRCWLGVIGFVCALSVWLSVSAQEPPPPAAPRAAPPPPAAAPAEVAPPGPAPTPEDNRITMDFQDVELTVLVKFISEITGRNFIYDERLKGKVTIISPSRITVDEAYTVFQSVLQVKGFTTVPAGSVIKIVQAQEAKSSTLETVLPHRPVGDTDEFITKLMPLDHVDANNILPIIQPLISPNGLLAAYAATNTLIIIDSAANIARISRIIRELDVEGSEQGLEVIRLNYAFAAELAAVIAQVLEEGQAPPGAVAAAPAAARPATPPAAGRRGQAAAPAGTTPAAQGGTGEKAFKIIPEERTNSLIVVAGIVQMRRIKDLIVRLDVPLPLGTGRVHVYHLKYANAFEIVPVLADLIGGGGGFGGLSPGLIGSRLGGSTAFRGGRLGQRGGFRGLGDVGGGGGTLGGFGGLGGLGGLGASGGLRGGLGSRGQGLAGLAGVGGAFGGRGGAAGGAGGVATAAGGGGEFEGDVRVTADPSTNALIVNASPQDFETLKRVIELLDVRRRQVFVEAIILEVRLDKDRDLGIALQGATGLNNGVGFGTFNPSALGAVQNPAASLATFGGLLLAAASNQTIRLPDGTVIPAQAAILMAAEGTTDVNVLSAPTILTTDNQEAEIVVGQNIPFVASRSTSETNLSNQFATIDRRDVGITLRLTPQISEGGNVRMDIFQEVSAVIEQAVAGLDPNVVGPSTTIRSATTTVVVRDHQTVVIGGLIADDAQNVTNKVPFVSDIPVVGNLFRTTNARLQKINLLIFLTPHIIRGARDHRDLSVERRDALRAFMQEQRIKNRRREYLERPSWKPGLPPDTEDEEEVEAEEEEDRAEEIAPRPSLRAEPAPREEHAYAATDVGALRPELPVTNRFVLLANLSTRGTVPDGLESASGLVAVELPADSSLTTLFRKGGRYRFSSSAFEGIYHCLEAYGTAQEALLVYPEGLPVDAARGEYLHWRKFEDPSSANVAAWTELN